VLYIQAGINVSLPKLFLKEVIAKVFNTGLLRFARNDKWCLRSHCEESSDEAISINFTFAIGSKDKNLHLIGNLPINILSGDFYHTKSLRPELILRHKPVAADGLSHTEYFA